MIDAHRCLNVCERVEVVEWNKKRSPPFPCCPVSCQCPWKKTLIEKKTKKQKKIRLENINISIKSQVQGSFKKDATTIRTPSPPCHLLSLICLLTQCHRANSDILFWEFKCRESHLWLIHVHVFHFDSKMTQCNVFILIARWRNVMFASSYIISEQNRLPVVLTNMLSSSLVLFSPLYTPFITTTSHYWLSHLKRISKMT